MLIPMYTHNETQGSAKLTEVPLQEPQNVVYKGLIQCRKQGICFLSVQMVLDLLD